MNNPMTRHRVAALAAVLGFCAFAAAPAVQAAQAGFYVGAYYGETKRDGESPFFDLYRQDVFDDFAFVPSSVTARSGTEESAFGFTAGYRLTEHIAFEGGYVDLGKRTYRSRSPGVFLDPPDPPEPANVDFNASSKLTGIALSALGILPVGRSLELYARGGFMFTTNKVSAFISDELGSLAGGYSESSTDLLAGAGVSMTFLEIYALRLEYQRVFDAGKADAGAGEDVDLVSLGITVAF